MPPYHFEVEVQESREYQRNHQYMGVVNPVEGENIEQKIFERAAEEKPGINIIHPQRKGPIGSPVPWQHNPGCNQQEYHEHLTDPGYPGELPRALIGLVIKHDDHMGKYGCQKKRRGPAMHISNQPTQRRFVAHLLDTVQGFIGFGGIEKEHEHARGHLQKNEKE